jgi:hypothetical protein
MTSGEWAERTALARGSRGDEEFVEFATASAAGLRHAAYLLTGDGHAAEEAVQTGWCGPTRPGPGFAATTPSPTPGGRWSTT